MENQYGSDYVVLTDEDGKEEEFIPKDLIGPVAEVLRWVQSLERS